MKYLLSLIVLLMPLKGFSPREGGGGNVCEYQGELVLLDEFYVDYGRDLPSDYNLSPIGPVYRDVNGEKVMDFTRMDTAPLILDILSWYERKLDKDLFRELKDFFLSLDTIYLKKDRFAGAWSPDGNARIGCAKGFMRAMLVSTTEGISVLSQEDWSNLRPQRKQMAMFHETMRLAQLHTSWFRDVLNEELSVLTMMMYYGAVRDLPKQSSWTGILTRLKSELNVPVTKPEIARARKTIETHLRKRELNLAVAAVSQLSLLLKRQDIQEGREAGMHFSSEMRKLRANPLYSSQVSKLVGELRKQ